MACHLLIYFMTFLICSSVQAYQHLASRAGDIYPNDDKSNCVFPFEYNDDVFNDCTFDPSNGPFPFCSLSKKWQGKFTYCYDFFSSILKCTSEPYQINGINYNGCDKIPKTALYEQCMTDHPNVTMRYCIEKHVKKSGKPLVRLQDCHKHYANLSDFHTMCIGPSDYAVPIHLSDADKQSLLEKHNQYRGIVNATCMMKLHWDNELAKIAQAHANMCAFDHDLAPNRLSPLFNWNNGQNMVLSSETRLPLATLLDLMFKAEKARFKYNETCINGSGSCLHYTQLMISDMTRVGCALTHCLYPDRILRILVCNYIQSQYSDTYLIPYRIGTPAGCCPAKKVGTLCDCGDKICKYDESEYLHPNTCECKLPRGKRALRKRDAENDVGNDILISDVKPFSFSIDENGGQLDDSEGHDD